MDYISASGELCYRCGSFCRFAAFGAGESTSLRILREDRSNKKDSDDEDDDEDDSRKQTVSQFNYLGATSHSLC